MDTALSDPLVGRLLDGRYRVEARLARGGMATVYRALDTRLERTVALKVMHPGLAEDEDFVTRFSREAKAAARLSHPSVVAVYDQGSEGGHVFLAMEYVEGRNLRDLLRERGQLTLREALAVLEPVLAALGAAHRAGLVHRDVKPENVLLADDGRVKVADFGLARAVTTTAHSMPGYLIGTLSYLSPEQVMRGIADPRSDVYAAGIMLYEMLTGEKPFEGDNPIHVAYRHVNEDVPAPSTRVPGLPPAVDALVAATTARDPDGRPPDGDALLAAVVDARRGLSATDLDATAPLGPPIDDRATQVMSVTQVVAHDLGPPPRPGTGHRRPGRLGPKRPGHGLIWLIVIIVLTLLVSLAAWWFGVARFTTVPAMAKLPQTDAAARAEAAGLQIAWKPDHHLTIEEGLVIRTEPAAGQRIRKDGTITAFVSRGPQLFAVPELKGKPLGEAKEMLADTSLAPGKVSRSFHDKVPEGQVIKTDPPAGDQLRQNSAVNLVVSKGKGVVVPKVVGQHPQVAAFTLKQWGLTMEVVGKVNSAKVQRGFVATQDPKGDTTVAEGSTVKVKTSKGAQMVAVPNVTGKKLEEARKQLRKAGFEVSVAGRKAKDARVVAHNPSGRAPKGSTINVWTI